MARFNKLLLAIDLSPESDLLINRVVEMCQDEVDKLHVVHVIKQGLHDTNLSKLNSDSNPNSCYNPHAQRVIDHTATRLREVLVRNGLNIPVDKIFLTYGEPAFEIKKLAGEIAADLVIVGSHSKADDWMHLPGATTNCVIQGIESDVMAVKV